MANNARRGDLMVAVAQVGDYSLDEIITLTRLLQCGDSLNLKRQMRELITSYVGGFPSITINTDEPPKDAGLEIVSHRKMGTMTLTMADLVNLEDDFVINHPSEWRGLKLDQYVADAKVLNATTLLQLHQLLTEKPDPNLPFRSPPTPSSVAKWCLHDSEDWIFAWGTVFKGDDGYLYIMGLDVKFKATSLYPTDGPRIFLRWYDDGKQGFGPEHPI
jgi:hypothetical protein